DFHDDRDIMFHWKLVVGGQVIDEGRQPYRVAPGDSKKFDMSFQMPPVDTRQEGALTLSLTVNGQEVFKDVKAVSVLAPAAKPAGLAKFTEKELLVYDPDGTTAAFLKQHGVAFTPLADLKSLPETGKVLLIGKDALSLAESTSSALAAYASAGRSIIVLE